MPADEDIFRFSLKKRKRSESQKSSLAAATRAATLTRHGLVADEHNENRDPSLTDELQEAKDRVDHYQARLYSQSKKTKRAKTTVLQQKQELIRQSSEIALLEREVARIQSQYAESSRQAKMEITSLHIEASRQRSITGTARKAAEKLKSLVKRIPARLATASQRAERETETRLAESAPSISLKEGGKIPDETRDLVNDLLAMEKVRPAQIPAVINRVAQHAGIRVKGSITPRSVRRIGKEGGLAAELQFVDAVRTSQGVTLSSDGTTHKNINLESHCATVIGPDNEKKSFFLGIGMAINHTSCTQLEGWEHLIQDIYNTWSKSSKSTTAEDARDFWIKVTGWHSDHAEDQKKLFKLAWEKKIAAERERRGERTIAEMAPEQWAEMLFEISRDAVADAGGLAVWDTLAEDHKKKIHDAAFTKFVLRIGQEEFDKLSAEEKEAVDLFIWGGCCMHKSMNVFKGACLAMQHWWEDSDLPGPVKLFNRDNAAAALLGEGTTAASRAEERSVGGALKVSSLAGAIFRHKDRKRGQQDTLRYFWDHELGFTISFPDTSNTRIGSHAVACEVIVVYMDLLLLFLEFVKENKQPRGLNHMETNVQTGLLCPYTRHEFVVIALMNENLEVPYMQEIRGPARAETNLLKLGQLHEDVKQHLKKIIANPKLVTGSATSPKTAALYGRAWQQPDVIYACLSRISEWELGHIDKVLVAFCQGALEKWGRFTEEWREDGPISRLSPQNVERAWLEVTNDRNEGWLGSFRQEARISPHISVAYFTALQMYKSNGTSTYVKGLPPEARQSLREQTRIRDGSGASRAAKHAIITHGKQVMDAHAKKDTARKDKIKKAQEKIRNTTAIMSVVMLETAFKTPAREEGYLSVAILDAQLDWHLANAVPDPASENGDTSASNIPKARTGPNGRGTREKRFEYLRNAIARRSELADWPSEDSVTRELPVEPAQPSVPIDVDGGGYDSEEEWHRGR